MNDSPVKRQSTKKRSNSITANPLSEDIFLFRQSPDQNIKSKVTLFQRFITIQPLDIPGDKYKIQFDMDTIFSILQQYKNEQEQKVFCGVSYGIKFQKFEDSIEILNYQHPEIFVKWKYLLQRFLSQRNFHQIFKPIKKIGKGNFASVYLVCKNQDKTLFAAKGFSKQIQNVDKKGKQSLQNQIKIMRSFNHDNLMKLYGVFQTQNSIYFVVQYLQGGLLYDKLKKRHTFTSQQVMIIMQSLLKGIAQMHSKRIMHRDLKPQNILFKDDDSFQCVIADFGLATFADLNQYIYTRCGTPGYVAPQISNLKDKQTGYEPICDMFSLGVIFHLLALGTSPFPGRSCDQVLKQNRQCNINFDAEIYKKLHPNWLDLLKKMLQKDPIKRIPAKQALIHEFFTQSSMAILQQLHISKYLDCDQPLMMTKNNNRKKNLRLRDDSCLRFKMKQNIPICKDQQENVQKINSPLRKRISRPRMQRTKTVTPSNFKQ